MQGLELGLRHEQGCAVVDVCGELDIASRSSLTAVVDHLVRDGCRRVVLDLHAMGFCDICGLDALEVSAQTVTRAQGELVLRDPRPQLVHLLAHVPLRAPVALVDGAPGSGGGGEHATSEETAEARSA